MRISVFFYSIPAKLTLINIRLVGHELRLACKVDESRRQQPGAMTKICCQVGQFPADSSSLQAEQEVTETLWSDSDLITCYQTHKSAHTQSPVVFIKGKLHRFSIKLCISRNLVVFLNDHASLPHVPLRGEISVLWVWKKASDDAK